MRKNKNFYRSVKANNADNSENKTFLAKNSDNAENGKNAPVNINPKTNVIADNAEKAVSRMVEEANISENEPKNTHNNNEAETAENTSVLADSANSAPITTNATENGVNMTDSVTNTVETAGFVTENADNATSVVENTPNADDSNTANNNATNDNADSGVLPADLDDFAVDNDSQEKDNFMHSPANFDFNMSDEPQNGANTYASEAPTEVISPNFAQSPRYTQNGAYGMPMSAYNNSMANGGYGNAYNNPYSANNMPPKQVPANNGMVSDSEAQADKIFDFFKKPIFWEIFGIFALVIVVLQLFVAPIFSRYNTYSYYAPRTQSQYNNTPVPRNNSDSRKDSRNNTDSDNSADSKDSTGSSTTPNNSMKRSALSEFDWYSLRGMRLSNAFALLQHYGLRENRDFKADFVTDNGDYVLLRSNWVVDKAQLDGNRVLFTLHQADNTPHDNNYYEAQKNYDQKLRNERDGIRHDNGAINNPSVLERLQRDGANAFRSAADSLKNAIGQAANGFNH